MIIKKILLIFNHHFFTEIVFFEFFKNRFCYQNQLQNAMKLLYLCRKSAFIVPLKVNECLFPYLLHSRQCPVVISNTYRLNLTSLGAYLKVIELAPLFH